MDEAVNLWEQPKAEEINMIAGWQQWADAGAVSSGLPQYLIDQTSARKIGEIKSDAFYLFQIPGTHDLLRPEIKLAHGHRKSLTTHKNEIYYSGDEHVGLVIFLGEEPHIGIEHYARAFFSVAKELGVKRVAGLGGVYGAMPYDKDRDVSCVYSLPGMKKELNKYAVRFSNYEGGASLGTYLADRAERDNVEYFTFYSFVPAYDFSKVSSLLQGIRVENDFRAWYDLVRRFNHMFHIRIDLADLEQRSDELTKSIEEKLEELTKTVPQLKINEFMAKVNQDFKETSFMPLDVWERELGDLFDDADE